MDTSALEKLRQCGRLETYSTARHHLGFYNNVGLTATYTTSSALKDPLENVVFTALRHVIGKHSNLSAIPVNEEKSSPDVYLARLPEIDLRTCVEFHARTTPIRQGDEADDELDELLRDQHDRNFKGNVPSRPYWRLLVTSSPTTPGPFTASWIFHHALCDGASSMLFHQSFLDGLNTPDLDASPIVKAPSTSLPPSLEELHPMTLSWTLFLRAIASSILPSSLTRPANLWTGPPVPPNGTPAPQSATQTLYFSAATTRALATKCREEKTSVTAALTALTAAALHASAAPNQALSIDVPISLRPCLAPRENEMLSATANCTASFPAPDSAATGALQYFSWAAARAVKRDIATEVRKNGADNPVALLRYVSNMASHFTQKEGAEREASAEVSCLGVWKGVQRDNAGWALSRLCFSQCVGRSGAPVEVCAVTGADGCLAVCFRWVGAGGVERVPGLECERQQRRQPETRDWNMIIVV
ncbi:alcohol acetyltransferase [Boeremia exigua]|uniref:alcohol acetyltransferase n=1 Tax=Boeremia exigua TaxID=749465 RepID=UPI001E8D7705|nr:alcohol acetyltransferase [Boeremia exigua]KAH6625914.1 alcohol acetyltransferase [Boeremia exigua]